MTSEKSRPSIFWPIAGVVVPSFSLLFDYEIEGELPAEGPFILAANHLSELDPVVFGRAVWKLGRKPRFMAKDSLWKIPVLGWLLRASGQIPVARGRGGQAAVDAAATLLESGGGVIVYPEGTLTREPGLWPMKGKSGAVRMAAELGIPLIPAAHWGTQAVFARYAKKPTLRFRAPVKVVIGKPMDLSALKHDPRDREIVAEASDRLMREITGLLEGIRGEKAPAELYDPTRANRPGKDPASPAEPHTPTAPGGASAGA